MRIEAAITYRAGAAFEIEPVDLDASAPGDILVRLVATGICHTDLTLRDAPMFPWPRILGHEGVGIVERVGPAVAGIRPGQPVILTTTSCGVCGNCRNGLPSWCARFAELNLDGGRRHDGTCSHSSGGNPLFGRFLNQSSFATFAVVDARGVVPAPEDLPLERLAPLGCGVQTGAGAVLNTLRPARGSALAVFGAGAIGLSAVLAARIAGCGRIVAIDRRPDRLALAAEFGATELVDAARLAPADVLAAASGVDAALECSGVPAVMEQAIAALGPNGTAVLVGIAPGRQFALDPNLVQARNLTIRSSVMAGAGASAQAFVPDLIAHMRAGDLPIERMIRYYGFADINQAVLDASDGTTIKPVLRFA